MPLISKISAAGYRLSQPRRDVFKLLQNAIMPMTPAVIHRELVEQGVQVGLASVYRTLNLLVKLDLAKVVLQPDGTTGYVPEKDGHNHTLVCQRCHLIYEFESCTDLSTLIQKVQDETHFLIQGHLLQLFGLCPTCQIASQNHD